MSFQVSTDRSSNPKTIFFSYGHDENRWIVEKFKRDLEIRAHTVWIDYDRIGSWEDWRGRITDGINTSDLAVAFLSIHSVRTPGVCRNEIAMALQKFGKVYSLLLEKLDPASADIPLTLKHLQWADLSNWKEIHNGDSFEQYYSTKLAEIISVIEGEATSYHEQVSYLSKVLRPVSFEGKFAQFLEGFTGREWLFSEFDDWLTHRPDSRLFWLSAGPGFGKTAWAINLAARHPSAIAGLWMCEHGNRVSSDPGRVLTTLAFQLAQRLDDYRSKLLESLAREAGSCAESMLDGDSTTSGSAVDSESADDMIPMVQTESQESDSDAEDGEGYQEVSDNCDRIALLLSLKNEEELFALLFREPMVGMIPGRGKHVLFIDALDEVSSIDGGNPLADLIDRHLDSFPEWLCVAVTSRADPAVTDRLGRFSPLQIKPSDENNREDLVAYCGSVLDRTLGTDASEASKREKLIQSLVDRSGGMILYLQRIMEGIAKGLIRPEDLESLGSGIPGLESYYLRDFQHRFKEVFHTKVQPILRLLLAASGQITEEFAAGVLGDTEEVRRGRIMLGSYLGWEGGAMQLAHKTVSDWLSGERSSVFYTDREKGKEQIGLFLWKCFEQRDQDSQDGKIRMRFEHEVLEMLPGLLPKLPQWRNAVALRAFGEFLNLRKSFRASVEISGRAYRMRKREKGADHAYTLRAQRAFGIALKGSGEAGKAVPVLREVFEKRRANPKLGKPHRLTLLVMNDLADALKESGQNTEAIDLLRERYAILLKTSGAIDPRTLRAGNKLAVLLRDSGALVEAREVVREMIPVMEKELQSDDSKLMAMKSLLGNIEEKDGDLNASLTLYKEVLAIRERKDPTAATTQLTLSRLGSCLVKKQDYLTAVPYLRRAWEMEISLRKGTDEQVWSSDKRTLLLNLTMALNCSGSRPEALELLRRNLKAFEDRKDFLIYNLACYECLEGNLEKAKELISEFLKVSPEKKDQALSDPDLVDIKDFIASLT